MSASKNLIQASAGNVAGGGDFYDYEIENSLRFNTGNTDYLTFTPSTNGNNTTFTLRFMVKLGNLDKQRWLFLTNTSVANAYTGVRINANNTLEYFNASPGVDAQMITSSVFRDVSSWYDIVISVSSTNVDIYVNGVEQPYGTVNQPSGADTGVNLAGTLMSTSTATPSAGTLDGYLAEMVLIDGQALTPTSFGEFKNGIWVPKDCSGLSFGTNGAYLKFGNSGALGTDSSGNSNNWTVNGLTSSDQVTDTPTNNFANLSIAAFRDGLYLPTLSNGNLEVTTPDSSAAITYWAFPSTGKYYFEIYYKTQVLWYRSMYHGISFADADAAVAQAGPAQAIINFEDASQNYAYNLWGAWIAGSGVSQGEFGAVLVDMDNNEVTLYRQGSATVTSSFPTAYIGKPLRIQMGGDGNNVAVFNFGQDGTFGGSVTAQGNTDANGIGDFYYTVPTGALALCTANLPEPTIGPNIDDTAVAGLPEEQFNILLYEGNSTNDRDITGVGFDPDLGIFKNRDEGYGWIVVDRNRGDGWSLGFDTGAQESGTGKFDSFITDGYRIDNHPGLNRSSIVNYSWKAGGTASSNTDGTITSSVSANTDAGISIITYTGNGVSGSTVGHGLGVTPAVIIHKPLYSGESWYYKSANQLGSWTNNLRLQLTNSLLSGSTDINNASTTTYTLGTSTAVNGNGNNYVGYAFAEVEGFSKFGTYAANANSNGPFVYTGFRPAFVIIKARNLVQEWILSDTERNPYNVSTLSLQPNSSTAESTGNDIDYVSNGFKIRTAGSGINYTSGQTYIYMAFAENPFKYANAR